MSVIDNKVVEMGFDNSNFEKNVKISMKTLEALKESLEFEDGTKGLKNLEKAAKSVDFGALHSALNDIGEKIKETFSFSNLFKMDTLLKYARQVRDGFVGVLKDVTIEPVSGGFGKYEDYSKSVKTMATALGMPVEQVTNRMDELLWYADETSYSLTDMTANVGNFVNSGVDLDTAVTSMMGIANAAAYAGVESTGASHAMTGFVKAMSEGYMTRQNWSWIQTAQVDSTALKQSFLDTAVSMGTLKKAGDGVYKTMKGTTVTAENFEIALKEGWLNKDVMNQALSEFGGFADQLYLEMQKPENEGKSATQVMDEMSTGYMSIGEQAFRAGQECRTFTQVIEYTKDAVSSGWLRTFQSLIGNADEATEIFSNMAEIFYDIFVAPGEHRNSVIDMWRELEEPGGREDLLQGIFDILESIASLIGTIREAWSSVFPFVTVQNLQAVSLAVKEFGAGMKTALTAYQELTSGALSFDYGKPNKQSKEVIGEFEEAFIELKRGSKDLEDDTGVKDMQTRLEELGYTLDHYGADGIFGPETQKALKKFQKEHNLTESGILDFETYTALMGDTLEEEKDAWEKIDNVIETKLPAPLKNIYNIVKGIASVAKVAFNFVKFGFQVVGKVVSNVFGPLANILLSVLGEISEFGSAFLEWVNVSGVLEGVLGGIEKVLAPIKKTLKPIAEAIQTLFDGLDWKELFEGATSFGDIWKKVTEKVKKNPKLLKAVKTIENTFGRLITTIKNVWRVITGIFSGENMKATLDTIKQSFGIIGIIIVGALAIVVYTVMWVVDKIRKGFGIIQDLFKQLSPDFKGQRSPLAQSLLDFAAKIGEAYESIKAWFTDKWSWVVDKWNNLFAEFTDPNWEGEHSGVYKFYQTIKGWGESIWSWITFTWNNIKTSWGNLFAEFTDPDWKGEHSGVYKFYQTIKGWGESIWSWITFTWNNIKTSWGNLFAEFTDPTYDGEHSGVYKFYQTIKGWGESIWSWITFTWNNIKTSWGNLFAEFTDPTYDGEHSGLYKFVTWLDDSIYTPLSSWFTDKWGWVKDQFNTLFSEFDPEFDGEHSALYKGIAGFKEWIDGLKLGEKFAEIGEYFSNLQEQMNPDYEGERSGLGAMLFTLKETVQGKLTDFYNWITTDGPTILEAIKTFGSDLIAAITEFVTGGGEEVEGEEGGLFSNIESLFSGEGLELSSLSNLSESTSELTDTVSESLGGLIGEDTLGKIGNVLKIGGIGAGLGILGKGVAGVIGDVADIMNPDTGDAEEAPTILMQIADLMKGIGIAVGAIVAAMLIFSNMDEESLDTGIERIREIINEVLKVFGVVSGVAAAGQVIGKFTEQEMSFEGLGDALSGLGKSLIMLTIALAILSAFPEDTFENGLERVRKLIHEVEIFVLVLGGSTLLANLARIGQEGDAASLSFDGLAQLGVALAIMAVVVAKICDIDDDLFNKGLIRLALVAAILGGLILIEGTASLISGQSKIKIGGLIGLGIALGAIAWILNMVKDMSDEEFESGFDRVKRIAMLVGALMSAISGAVTVIEKFGGGGAKVAVDTTLMALGVDSFVIILEAMVALQKKLDDMMGGDLTRLIEGGGEILGKVATALGSFVKPFESVAAPLAAIIIACMALGAIVKDPTAMAIAIASVDLLFATLPIVLTAMTAILGGVNELAGAIASGLGVDLEDGATPLTEAIESGGDVLAAVGTAIGRFVGGLQGGAEAGKTESLGRALKSFSESFDVNEDDKTSITDKVGLVTSIAQSIHELFDSLTINTLTDDEYADMWAYQTMIENFNKDVVDLGTAISTFKDQINGIFDSTIVEDTGTALGVATSIAGFITSLTSDEYHIPTKKSGFLGRMDSYTTESDEVFDAIKNLGSSVSQLKTGIAGLADTSIIVDTNIALLVAGNIADFISKISGPDYEIPTSPSGFLATGESTPMDEVVEAMGDLGLKMPTFVAGLSSISDLGILFKTQIALSCARAMANFINSLDSMSIETKETGFLSWFSGEQTKADSVFESIGQLGTKLGEAAGKLTAFEGNRNYVKMFDSALKVAVSVAEFLQYLNDEDVVIPGADSIWWDDPKLNDLLAGIPRFVEKVADYFNGTGKDLGDDIPDLSWVADGIVPLITQLGAIPNLPDISTILSSFAAMFSSENSFSTDSFMKDLDPDGVAEKISAFVDAVGTAVTENSEELSGYTEQFAGAGTDLAGDLVSGITAGTSQVSGAAEGASSAAKSAATDMQGFIQVGAFFDAGFARGINQNTSFIEEAAKAAARAAKTAADTELNAQSPSREMMKRGKWFDLGFANGISKYGGAVDKSASAMSSESLDTVSAMLDEIYGMADDDFDSNPKIVPLVDIGNVRDASKYFDEVFSDRSMSVRSSNMASDIERRGGAATKGGTKGSPDVVAAVNAMGGRIDMLGVQMQNFKMVTDTGALVGQITNQMDHALGRKSARAGRFG